MNRAITIVVALIVIVFLAIGVMVFLSTRTPTDGQPVTPTTPSGSVNSTNATVPVSNNSSEAAVRAAYLAELKKFPVDNVQLHKTVVVGEYALQSWAGDVSGGEALLKYESAQRQWVLIDAGGGKWPVETLVTLMGVPQDVAEALVAGMAQ